MSSSAAAAAEVAKALEGEEGAAEQIGHERSDVAERERLARVRDERIAQRMARRRDQEIARRFVPGPGPTFYSPGMVGTASRWAPTAEQDLDERSTRSRELSTSGA